MHNVWLTGQQVAGDFDLAILFLSDHSRPIRQIQHLISSLKWLINSCAEGMPNI